MSASAAKPGAGVCPLCSRPNQCQLCTVSAYKGPCWCAKLEIPEALIAQVPQELRKLACLCSECVMAFHRASAKGADRRKILPGDYYYEKGLMVFTAAYHLRRGYCCASGCRHCPYLGASKTQ
jgi:hypothetical protein